jgi:hypothetical protein
MPTVTVDTAKYSQGIEHSVELEITTNTSEKTTLLSALSNAGRVGKVDYPLADVQHFDTTTDGSNTVTFNINNNPTGVPSSVTLYVQNFSYQVISPEPKYKFRIRGYSE